MKLPVIRHLHKSNNVEQLKSTIEVLESFTEHQSCTEEEMDIVGELLTNLCGAVEVHKMVEDGMTDRDAVRTFAQRVMGSIDK